MVQFGKSVLCIFLLYFLLYYLVWKQADDVWFGIAQCVMDIVGGVAVVLFCYSSLHIL